MKRKKNLTAGIIILLLFSVAIFGADVQRWAKIDGSGVLLEHGFTDYPPPRIAVASNFNLDPGKWRWDGTQWVAHVPPLPPADPKIVDLKAKIDAALANPLTPQAIKDFLTSFRATLP